MGVLADSLGRQGEAVAHYTAYLRWAPQAEDRETVKRKVFQLCGNLGALCYENRQYLLALDWYEKARDLYPYAKAVHYNMCRVYEARGDWQRAAGSLKEYHALCPPNEKGQVKNSIADFLQREGEARFASGEYDSALVNFQEAARWNPEDSRLLLNQALAEEKLGYLADAKNHYLAYLQVDPTVKEREAILERIVHLHGRLAEEYLDEGYLARAQDILDKGLEIDPENPEFHHLFAKTHLELGQPEQAIAYLERILQLRSKEEGTRPYVKDLVQLCTSLADEAYRRKDYEDALRFLQKALLWDPDNPLVAYNLARVYERQNDWEQAILAYRRYLLLDPDAAERNEVKAKLAYYYSYLGAERFVRGEYAPAQEAFEQALLVKPEDQALLYNLAMVLLKRGKTTEALHFLERYIRHERDPQEITRVQKQIASLLSLTEAKTRKKRGESVSSELVAMDDRQESATDRALADRERAFLLLQSGRWQEALGVYDQCLRRFPSIRAEAAFQKELASAYREVSRAYLVDGNMTEALYALDKARLWAPAEAFPYLWKGRVYEQKGDSEEALRVYRESLRKVQGIEGRQAIRERIVSILTQRLQMALRQEDFYDALETMNTLEPYLGEEQARDVHYQKARIEEAVGRRRAALVDYGFHLYEASQVLGDPRMREELMNLLGDEPDLVASLDDPSEAYRRGKEAANRGDHSKALFCFLMVKGSNRAPADLDSEILRSLEALRMDRKALTILSHRGGGRKSLRLPHTQTDQFISRAEAVLRDDFRSGQYEKGLERVRGVQAQLLVPDERLMLMEGIFEEMIGSYEEAIHRYERALGEGATLPEPQVSPVSQRLCGLLIRKALGEYEEGAYEACLDSLRRAEKAVPGRADVAFNIGCVHLRLRNPNGALQAFSRYMELEPDESPRKELTGNAILVLQRQVARSPVVRYDADGIAVDLIFERPISLGHLLAAEDEGGRDRMREEILDKVVLAPYLETQLDGEGAASTPAFAWD
jgi:tetratricopeptide (TPR) repeat protein